MGIAIAAHRDASTMSLLSWSAAKPSATAVAVLLIGQGYATLSPRRAGGAIADPRHTVARSHVHTAVETTRRRCPSRSLSSIPLCPQQTSARCHMYRHLVILRSCHIDVTYPGKHAGVCNCTARSTPPSLLNAKVVCCTLVVGISFKVASRNPDSE